MQTVTTKIDYTKKHWYILESPGRVEIQYGQGLKTSEGDQPTGILMGLFFDLEQGLNQLLKMHPHITNRNKIPGYVNVLNAYNARKENALKKARLVCATFNQNKIKP